MTDLRDRLQTAVGDAYRIEKELGGGGMSRVFLAEEVRLGRKVVIKLLPPEMSAGVNVERFEREIQLAAKLQHPHIVPLLTAGASGDLLYYVMPFIEGESLRAKLAREGELPIPEVIRILHDVLDALSYAHEQGIVHRDIKPDNVMLSRRHAVVTDFGVAKAVASSTGASSLTSLGVALGTPSYMSPEQAAADPHVDHRADLYAVGAMAYEMLSGSPPFTGASPQMVLAAHVTQAPDPLGARRPSCPPALAELVMRCLAKRPADRPQKSEELIGPLMALLTPTGGMTPTAGMTPTGTQPVPAVSYEARARRAHPVRVGIMFALAAAAVLGLVYWIMLRLGLPDWVFLGAAGLLVVGLPIILATGYFERKRALARATGVHTLTPVGMKRLFTWRKALLGGGIAFAGLGLVAAVYTGMRLLGIGPVGTLLASGKLERSQPILLADFINRSSDSTLGPTLTEAFRVDLSQSSAVQLLDPRQIAAGLRRMQKPGAHLTPDVARELAEREGVTAVVTGQIDPVGQSYVLSASVVSTSDGKVLASVRKTADDDAHLIPALDELSRDLRERIGESLVSIRQTQPLEDVTTGSLEALRKYTEANHLFDRGDFDGAIALLRQAIGLDSSFAMAYRKLAAALYNTQASATQQIAAGTRAFQLRDRLPPTEGDLTAAWYYDIVNYDPTQAIAAYRAVLDRDPDNDIALNNLSIQLNRRGEMAQAESLAARGARLTGASTLYQNLAVAQVDQGHLDAADTTLSRWQQASPGDPGAIMGVGVIAGNRQDYAAAERAFRRMLDSARGSEAWRARSLDLLAQVTATQGRLAQAERYREEAAGSAVARDIPGSALMEAARIAIDQAFIHAQPAAAQATLKAALARYPLASIRPEDRPYPMLAAAYALTGQTDEARRTMAEYQRMVPEGWRKGQPLRLKAEGDIAFAEQRWPDAVTAYRQWSDESGCGPCGQFEIGQVFDRLGQPDSALVYYHRSATVPDVFRLAWADPALGPTYRRMGELYEQKGDRARALESYGKFVALWKNADADLQPLVRDVKSRIAALTAQGG